MQAYCSCAVAIEASLAAAQLASGEVFGHDQPIALHLLGSERSAGALEGVAMELEDSLYPLLREVPAPRVAIVAYTASVLPSERFMVTAKCGLDSTFFIRSVMPTTMTQRIFSPARAADEAVTSQDLVLLLIIPHDLC